MSDFSIYSNIQKAVPQQLGAAPASAKSAASNMPLVHTG